MDVFRFDPVELPAEARTMRARIRAHLQAGLARGDWRPGGDFTRGFSAEFSRALGQAGFLGLTWPQRYGGQARSTLERHVVTEELLVAGAPVGAHWVADRQSGPLLLRFGTEPQKLRYLPGIAAGEIYFAIGMSEPGAGSDLASVRTRAERVDGGWRIRGRKVWTTWAHRCHFAIVLVRTSPVGDDGVRHRGLSQFVVDLHAPGVLTRPIVNMAGSHEFNEITFDDAFVPNDALVGELGNGWRQIGSELAHERSGPERYLGSIRLLVELARAAGPEPDARVAEALGRFAAQLATLRRMSHSVAGMLAQGGTPNLEAALVKDLGNAFERAVPEAARLLRDALPGANEAAPPDAQRAFDALLEECLLTAPSWSLRGGTREILRNIIGKGLGRGAR